MALLDVEADTCQGCGQPLSETTEPEAFGGYRADLPVRCNGCDAMRIGQKDYIERPYFHALRFGVRRIW